LVDEEADVPSGELFIDDRGNALRVRWHEDRKSAVMSLWRDGACVGTIHVTGDDDLLRMSAFFAQAWSTTSA
jgi:hypothetical protein